MKKISNNLVRLIGNVGQAPELRQLNGKKFARFSLATVFWHKGENAKPKSELRWYQVVAWGPQAELVANQLEKGSAVIVTGDLRFRDYLSLEGERRRRTELILQSFSKREVKQKSADARSSVPIVVGVQ